MTEDNAAELPDMLDLVEREGFHKFYLSHLVYAGRGNKNRGDDAIWQTTRDTMDMVIDRAWRWAQSGSDMEIVTGNNDADAVYLLHWAERTMPHAVEGLRARLVQWGGNSSGVNVANIDNLGNVHPDTMWWHYTLGNVKERPFSAIWTDLSDPIMAGLKRKPRVIGGRCGQCAYLRHLRRQHPRARDAHHRRSLGRGPRLLSHRRRDRPRCGRSSASRSALTAEHAMKRRFRSELAGALLVVAGLTVPALAEPDAAKLFAEHCAACHGADRLGGQGPALLPENLGRLMGPRRLRSSPTAAPRRRCRASRDSSDKDEIAALAAYHCDAAAADADVGQRRRSPRAASSTPPRRRSTGRASTPIR